MPSATAPQKHSNFIGVNLDDSAKEGNKKILKTLVRKKILDKRLWASLHFPQGDDGGGKNEIRWNEPMARKVFS